MEASANTAMTELMSANWDGQFPVDAEELASGLIFQHPFVEPFEVRVAFEDIDGNSLVMEYTEGEGGQEGVLMLKVNRQESEERQRYSLMYGLARMVLAGALNDLNQSFWDFNPKMSDPLSWKANRMTLDALVPKKYLKNRARKVTDIAQLASEFGVAPVTVQQQLQNAGVLPSRKELHRQVA